MTTNATTDAPIKAAHQKAKAIAHHLPHRTRIKLPRSHRDAASIARITVSVKRVNKVSSVEVNPRTGSMLVYHEEDTEILGSLQGALGEVAGELLEAALEAEAVSFPGLSIVAHLIGKAMGKADTHLSSATNNLVDLKTMLPVTLVAAGVTQSLRSGVFLGPVPNWVFFYMAYDTYMRFHSPSMTAISQKLTATKLPDADSIDIVKETTTSTTTNRSKPKSKSVETVET
jgi:hypothetical protein